MNWLKSSLPKINKIFGWVSSIGEEQLWHTCVTCSGVTYIKNLVDLHYVCPHCQYHGYMPPKERFKSIFDEGSYQILDKQHMELADIQEDPLSFKDIVDYASRLQKARDKTNSYEAICASSGVISGVRCVAVVQDFRFMGGSVGRITGEIFYKSCLWACKNNLPMVAFTSSGGMRMQEGTISLMQMPKSILGVRELGKNGLPYIVVLTHPTTGGVTASFAMMGDVIIAEPDALIGFAGPKIIKETIKKELPEGFQRPVYLQKHGMIDQVVARKDLKMVLSRALKSLGNPFYS